MYSTCSDGIYSDEETVGEINLGWPRLRAHLNGSFCTGEALSDACSVLGDDSLLLKVSHPGERVFEREVHLAVVMIEPELFVFQLRLRMMEIAIGSTFDAQIETRL